MKLYILFVVGMSCIGLIGASDSSAAESQIYKTVDEDGNVVFTDVPPKESKSAEKVTVNAPNTADLGASSAPDSTVDAQEEALAYRSLRIASPEHDQAVRGNHGDVQVEVEVLPALQSDHQLRLLLDGAPEHIGRQSIFILSDVDRGSHTLQVEVLRETGDVLFVSDPSVFHLQRYAIETAPNQDQPTPSQPIAPPRPRPRSN